MVNENIGKVYYSGIQRAKQSVECVVEGHDTPAEMIGDPLVIGISWGVFEGKTYMGAKIFFKVISLFSLLIWFFFLSIIKSIDIILLGSNKNLYALSIIPLGQSKNVYFFDIIQKNS